MKQNLLEKLATGMLLLAMPFVFNSCGNIDNPLEEILNSSSSATTFQKWNGTQWENFDLQGYKFQDLTPAFIESLVDNGAGSKILEAGKYRISGLVTINAGLLVGGDGTLEFYLNDGAKLDIKGTFTSDAPIAVYGQKANTGELSVKATEAGSPAIETGKLTVEGGSVKAESTDGAGMNINADATVRGGIVEAKGVACGIDVGGGEGKLTVTGSATVSVTATGADGGGNGHHGVNGDVVIQATGNDNIQFVAAGGAGTAQDGKACNNLFPQYWDEDKKSWQPGTDPNAILSTSDDGVYWTEQSAPESLDGSMQCTTRFLSFLQRVFLEHF